LRSSPGPGGTPINQKIIVSNNPFNNEQRREQIKQQQVPLQQQQQDVKSQPKGRDLLAAGTFIITVLQYFCNN